MNGDSPDTQPPTEPVDGSQPTQIPVDGVPPEGAPPAVDPAIQAAIDVAISKQRDEHAAEMETLKLENARLQGQISAGVTASGPKLLGSEAEYRFYADALQSRQQLAAGAEDANALARIQAEQDALRASYQAFQQQQATRAQEKQDRRIARASFFARRNLDPESVEASIATQLHDGGMTLEAIEHRLLAPHEELAKLRGETIATDANTDAMTAATQIEGGNVGGGPRAPIARAPEKTPQQQTGDEIVDFYERYGPRGGLDSILSG